MTGYWLGMLVGLSLGTYLGILLMTLLFVAKREDKRMGIEEGANSQKRKIKKDLTND